MTEDEKTLLWTIKLDWLNIVSMLNLNDITQITEIKKLKALKRVNTKYGSEKLMDFEPEYLESLVAEELKELMKKKLSANAKIQAEREKEIRSKLRGGIIKLDPSELKDFYKKFLGKDDDDKDDEKDKYNEDNTSYYI